MMTMSALSVSTFSLLCGVTLVVIDVVSGTTLLLLILQIKRKK
jgi:hypothetical protein